MSTYIYALMPLAEFKGLPHDLVFRQNTFSLAWIDAVSTIGMREVTIMDQLGVGIPSGEGGGPRKTTECRTDKKRKENMPHI
jgi:hypothetical protein